MLAFNDIKASSAINITGLSPASTQFRDLLNDATRRLIARGFGPIVPIQVCIGAEGCITWPRYIGSILKINVCNAGVPVSNVWYSFLPFTGQNPRDNFWYSWLGQPTRITTQLRVPVQTDIMGDGRLIRAYPSTALDKNKTIRIFGTDNNGQQLMTQGIGGWKDGITITMDVPYGTSAQNVRSIDRVIKDKTQGPVRMYAYYTAGAVLEDLATYAPDETNPSYLRTQLSGCGCTGCTDTRSVVALVKLQFVPVTNDDDWVLIDNLDALKLMMLSLKAEEAVDRQTARAYEADAVRELNLQLDDANLNEQIPVTMGAFADTGIGRQGCF